MVQTGLCFRTAVFLNNLVVVVVSDKKGSSTSRWYTVIFLDGTPCSLSNTRTGCSVSRWNQHKEKHQENNITRNIPYIDHRLNSIRYGMYVIWITVHCMYCQIIRMNDRTEWMNESEWKKNDIDDIFLFWIWLGKIKKWRTYDAEVWCFFHGIQGKIRIPSLTNRTCSRIKIGLLALGFIIFAPMILQNWPVRTRSQFISQNESITSII